MSEEKEFRNNLLEVFLLKTSMKQKVYDNTIQAFLILGKVLKQLEKDYIKILDGKVTEKVSPRFREKGPFELEFTIGSDMLIFSMHSNVFGFDRVFFVRSWRLPFSTPYSSTCWFPPMNRLKWQP